MKTFKFYEKFMGIYIYRNSYNGFFFCDFILGEYPSDIELKKDIKRKIESSLTNKQL